MKKRFALVAFVVLANTIPLFALPKEKTCPQEDTTWVIASLEELMQGLPTKITVATGRVRDVPAYLLPRGDLAATHILGRKLEKQKDGSVIMEKKTKASLALAAPEGYYRLALEVLDGTKGTASIQIRPYKAKRVPKLFIGKNDGKKHWFISEPFKLCVDLLRLDVRPEGEPVQIFRYACIPVAPPAAEKAEKKKK